MSLINDALKRAKDAQQKSPPVSPGPQLRPADPTPATAIGGRIGMRAPVIVILIVLAGLSLLWLGRYKPVENPTEAKTAAPANPIPETKPPIQTVAVSIPSAAANPPAEQSSAAPSDAPAPPQLKLQAIFFVPGRSSAIINGKTLRAGDTVQGFHVAVINRSGATLVSATQTNVMTLEQ